MVIFLPFKPKKTGGTSIFVSRFKYYMEKMGHKVYYEKPAKYDVMLIVVQTSLKNLLDAKLRHVPIIQRLDGVYYFSISGWKFLLFNLKALLIRHIFADYSIYQSVYSHYCADKYLLPKNNDKYTTIFNGVDTLKFSSKGKKIKIRDNKKQVVFINISDFRRLDQIDPIINSFKIYKKTINSNSKMIIIGNFRGQVSNYPDYINGISGIMYLGVVDNNLINEYLRSSDVFVHTHLNPPCPNNVLEALASGLPVCGIGDGGMPELVTNNKDGTLVPVNDDGFWKIRKFNYKQFVKNMNICVNNRNIMGSLAEKKAKKYFSILNIMSQYENYLSSSIKP